MGGQGMSRGKVRICSTNLVIEVRHVCGSRLCAVNVTLSRCAVWYRQREMGSGYLLSTTGDLLQQLRHLQTDGVEGLRVSPVGTESRHRNDLVSPCVGRRRGPLQLRGIRICECALPLLQPPAPITLFCTENLSIHGVVFANMK